MDIGGRIVVVRWVVIMTLLVFVDAIGLRSNTVATYEMGKAFPSDRTIADICRKFNVYEVWLRTGEGEMFLDLGEDEEFLQVMEEIHVSDDHLIREIITAYWHMSDAEKAALRKLVETVIKMHKEKAGQ